MIFTCILRFVYAQLYNQAIEQRLIKATFPKIFPDAS
jgi:hypothetical protein